jgi:uncharacterized protein (DUF2141 family)
MDNVAGNRKPLKLIIENLGSPTAPILIGLYGKGNDFLNEKDTLKKYKFIPEGDALNASITDLEYGTYAMALFQDMDNDGKIERNFLGIPKDPYAFSNNARPAFKAPSFDDCCFEYNDADNLVEISMIR